MLYSIYCDESCHLINDGEDIMVIGGISCRTEHVKTIYQEIRQIKTKHRLNPHMEIKWTKISGGQIDFYKELIDYYFENPYLNFRAVVATGKRKLNYDAFNLTHDKWYYRIYYLLLRNMVQIGNQYKVYVDIKDTRSGDKIHLLQKVLNQSLDVFCPETIQNIQLVHSHEIEIIQLADLLIGAISYANRNINTSIAKNEIVELIRMYSGRNLTYSTPASETKFNIFVWRPREVGQR